MDRVFDAHALFLELVRHLAQRVLCLRHRHAVAGDDDDLFGLRHEEGGILGTAAPPRAVDRGVAAARACAVAAEAARDHPDEAAVHRSSAEHTSELQPPMTRY